MTRKASLPRWTFGALLLLLTGVAWGASPLVRRTFLVALILGYALGALARRLWLWPRRLAQAEVRWAAGAPPSEVLDALGPPPLAFGELAYRMTLLRARAQAALGFERQAWADGLEAQLRRLPPGLGLLASLAFRNPSDRPSRRRLAFGDGLLRWAPNLGRLWHLQGILLRRTKDPEDEARAWVCFQAAVPRSMEDPAVLDDLLRAGLAEEREALVEACLDLLQSHHGDPRVPWHRGGAGLYLLQRGRPLEALALARGLPETRRQEPLVWLVEAASRRALGDAPGAWEVVEAALARHPESFVLWIERHAIALDLGRADEASQSLDRAWPCIPEGPEAQVPREEWHRRRAEFAFYWEGNPGLALQLLEALPPDRQGHHHPPLRLQLLVAEGRFDEAQAALTPLLATLPQDPDLQLLQAECLLGLEAWDALMPYLNGLGEVCRERPTFWHLRGLALAHAGDHAASRQDLERAARLDPRDVRLLLDAGHASAELADWTRAEAQWRRALELEPQDEEALVHLAEARREMEDLEGARRYLRECLLHHPNSTDAQLRLAELERN